MGRWDRVHRGLVDKMPRRGWSVLVVALAYALITVAMTYPVAFRLSSAVAGLEGEDALQYVWSLWWTKKALLDLHTSPADLTYLYHPTGAYHPMVAVTPYAEFLALPLVSLWGPVIAYNIEFLISFVLTGLTTYLFCYYLTGDKRASFVGGLIFAFFPNRTFHALGHLPQITTYWLPLYALFLFRLLRNPKRKNAFSCGILLALSLLVHIMHIAYFIIPFTLLFFLYYWVVDRRLMSPRFLKGFLMALLLAGLLTAPLFIPFVVAKFTGRLGYLRVGKTVKYSADLLAFFTPSAGHPVFDKIGAARRLRQQVLPFAPGPQDDETLVYVGFVALALGLWGSIKERKRGGLWIILGLTAALLSLGPFLKVGGKVMLLEIGGWRGGIPLPYGLVERLPFYEWGRTPARLTETTMFCLAILASYGLRALLASLKGQRAKTVLTLGLAIPLLFEYVVVFPFPTGDASVPPFYRGLGREEDYAILNIPLYQHYVSNVNMYYQTVHEHKIVGGYIHRVPADALPVARYLERLVDPFPQGDDIVAIPGGKEGLNILSRNQIRYVVLHPPFLKPQEADERASFLTDLLGEPVYADGSISVFLVPPSPGGSDAPAMALGENWYPLEDVEGTPFRWMSNEGTIYVNVASGGEYRLHFFAYPLGEARHLQVMVDGEPVGQFYVERFQGHVTKPFFVGGGEWGAIGFYVQEGCQRPNELFGGGGDFRCLSILFQSVDILPAQTGNEQ